MSLAVKSGMLQGTVA